MVTSHIVYLVSHTNLVVGAFTSFDLAVAYVRKRYGKTPELRHVVISGVPVNPLSDDDEE